MKPFLTLTAASLSILTASIVLGASPLPPEPKVGLNHVFVGHMTHLRDLIKNVPRSAVEWADLNDMFNITIEANGFVDALDPLCKAYPQTNAQWRTESFLPYVHGCLQSIQASLKILDATEKSKVPEVRDEARQLRSDLLTMQIWILGLTSAPLNESPTVSPKPH
jgi:hypothetical protein